MQEQLQSCCSERSNFASANSSSVYTRTSRFGVAPCLSADAWKPSLAAVRYPSWRTPTCNLRATYVRLRPLTYTCVQLTCTYVPLTCNLRATYVQLTCAYVQVTCDLRATYVRRACDLHASWVRLARDARADCFRIAKHMKPRNLMFLL